MRILLLILSLTVVVSAQQAAPLFTAFRVTDASGAGRVVGHSGRRNYIALAYVGEYRQREDVYYMYIYADRGLVAQASFPGQRGGVQSSAFKLGVYDYGIEQQMWYVAFAVYNRSLSSAEVAAWRPEAPVGGDLVMHYYAHPQHVRDVDSDGVLEWLDLSGNNRHAKLRGAVPQWFVEPAALSAQQCGGVSLSATWDGFTAVYSINGTSQHARQHLECKQHLCGNFSNNKRWVLQPGVCLISRLQAP